MWYLCAYHPEKKERKTLEAVVDVNDDVGNVWNILMIMIINWLQSSLSPRKKDETKERKKEKKSD